MEEYNRLKNKTYSLIFLIALVFVLYILKPLIIPVLLAVIFSILIFPIQKFLEKKWKCNRLFATICSISIMFLLTVTLVLTVGSQLQIFISNSDTYTTKFVHIYEDSIRFLENYLNIKRSQSLLLEEVNFGKLVKNNIDKISAFALEWGTVFTDLFLMPIYMFFFLYYRKFFRNFAYRAFNKTSNPIINSIINKIYNVQRNYLLGLVKVIIIVGVLNSIGLLILGIENAIFFGFFAAILLVIPYVGVIVGSLLPALVALATKDSSLYALGVILIFGFIQFIEGYFITPKIIGSDVSVNSFIAIFALLSFAMLWGVAGMIVALPITATLKIIFDHSTAYKAYGFLIGEPNNKFLQTQARLRLNRWKKLRNK